MKNLLLLFLTFSFSAVYAQDERPLDNQFHKERRSALRQMMPSNSVAVFFAAPIRNRANDVNYYFHQDPDFFYLTGYQETGAVLIVFKEMQQDEDGSAYNEIVFSRNATNHNVTYEGELLGVEGVGKLGFAKVMDAAYFKSYSIDYQSFDKVFYYQFYNDIRDDANNDYDLYDLVEDFKLKMANIHSVKKKRKKNEEISPSDQLLEYMAKLREVKTDEEVELMRRAIEISCVGQIEVMKSLQPHDSELSIQGTHEFVHKKYGAAHEGYPAIVGAGHNGCILHYIDNDKFDVNKELVLMDVGAEYYGYTADVTRTIPSDGKYSEEEKAIYNLVMKAQQAAMDYCRPSNIYMFTNAICRDIINAGLAQLGIIENIDQEHNYLPHGVTHQLGLDVHDPSHSSLFKENMILTIEPGIYIPKGSNCDTKWWGIAIRIEDDILITTDGYENLSDCAPRSIEAIEAMMEQKSVLNDLVLPDIK